MLTGIVKIDFTTTSGQENLNIREMKKMASDGKLMKIKEMLKALMDKKFTGYIRINFMRGTVAKIEKFEEIIKK